MRRLAVLCLLLLCASPVRASPTGDAPDLLPRPSAAQPGTGSFTVTEATKVTAEGPSAAAAAREFIALLTEVGGPAVSFGRSSREISFIRDPRRAKFGQEAYQLRITPTDITITSAGAAGLFYGGVSLWQLLTGGTTTLAAQTITDGPRFPWRGLMIDSARHYQSPAYIKKFITWMAVHKLNLLHWHLTDDQGWRLEIRHYPRLTSFGPFYSQAEVREIVAFASARHVTILPEIDLPGHATAAIAAYPELGVAPVHITAPSQDWGIHDNLIDPTPSNLVFFTTILDEVMALFPGPFIHVGGDEAVKDQWRASPEVQAQIHRLGLKDEDALQSFVIGRMDEFLTAHGRRLIGWDEILQGGLSRHASVMSWRGIDGAIAAARAGHDTVLSPWPLLYFDNRQSDLPSEPPGRGHIVSLEDVYRFDPMPAALQPSERHHVLGLQANLWSEHMRTEEQMTRMAFPRAAALAEIAWTPPALLDWQDFQSRLHDQERRTARLGLKDDHAFPSLPDDGRVYSQQLRLCSDKLTLSLEDDAPAVGPRAIFLVDLMNPCWIYPQAQLEPGIRLTVAVGQHPFNFQIGADRDMIQLLPAATPDGELQIRVDGCDGDPIAVVPLAEAARNPAITRLTAQLAGLTGAHDLCFRFTGHSIDPIWAIDWIDLGQPSDQPRERP